MHRPRTGSSNGCERAGFPLGNTPTGFPVSDEKVQFVNGLRAAFESEPFDTSPSRLSYLSVVGQGRQGVQGHDAALQAQHAQQLRDGRNFVGLVVHRRLGQALTRCRGPLFKGDFNSMEALPPYRFFGTDPNPRGLVALNLSTVNAP